jgi:WD40 repeat protein
MIGVGGPMPGNVFINYRRGDDPGTTGRLFDRLEQEFGKDALFMDVEGHIKAGDDYVEVLRGQVAQCDVLLAVIGPRWLSANDDEGRRRLDNPEDWVRVEIVGALEAGSAKRVIPVLVADAEMPRAEDLPEGLKPLARKQAVRITLERFRSDTQGLINQVTAVLADLEAARLATTAAEKAAAAEAERKRIEEEQARADAAARREAERARLATPAGLSPQEIRKAEELANWDFVKDRSEINDFRDHLARFAAGPTERYALAKLEALVWAGLGAVPTLDQLRAFLDEFPKGTNAEAARAKLAELERAGESERQAQERRRQETEDWGAIAASTDTNAITSFLKVWPDGQHAAAAGARLKELRGGRFSRRVLLRGFGYGVGATAAVSGVYWASFTPGAPIWRLINDRSVRTLTGHSRAVTAVAITPDGRQVVTGSNDGRFRVWNLATGGEERASTEIFGYISAVAISPDGRYVVAGGDSDIAIWDISTGGLLHTWPVHSRVLAVAIAPDGRHAVTGTFNGTVTVRVLPTGGVVSTFTGHSEDVAAVAITPDGRLAISGGGDKALKVWNLATGGEVSAWREHSDRVNAVAITPDGRRAVSGSSDRTLIVRELPTSSKTRGLKLKSPDLDPIESQTYGSAVQYLRGHSDRVKAVAITPDSRHAVSGSSDRTIIVWNLTTGGKVRTLTGHSGSVNAVAITPDGRLAITGSSDGTLKVWDLGGL